MKELPYFNRNTLDILFGSNDAYKADMLEILKEDLPAHLKSLELCTLQEDFSGIYASAHTMKGTLLTVGAEHAGALSAELLSAAEEKNPQRCSELISCLQSSVSIFLEQFEESAGGH